MALVKWICMLLGWIAADFVWYALARRSVSGRRFVKFWRGLLLAFVLLQAGYVGTIVAGVFTDHVPEFRSVLYWPVCAYVWHLFVMPGSLLWMAGRAGWQWGRRRWARSRAGAARSVAEGQDGVAEATPPGRLTLPGRLTRREALAAVGVALPPLITGGVGVYGLYGLGNFRVRQVELKLPTLPPDLDGLTVAHISDLHIGRFLPDGTAKRVAEATNALGADLVVFTGDLNDASQETLGAGIDFIRRLDPRTLAMIEGNHDGMRGADWFEGEMKAAGMPLLLDEAKVFRVPGRATPVQVMGVTWGEMRTGREIGQVGKAADHLYRMPSDEAMSASVQAVAARRAASAFPILLAHHPHALDHAVGAGLPLVLSGHTHGGQIMLTEHIGAGPLRFKYWSGQYAIENTRLFVNSGIGNWFPLRVNAPAEVVKLVLRRG